MNQAFPARHSFATLCLLAFIFPLLAGCSLRSTGTVSYAGPEPSSSLSKFAWLEPPTPAAMPVPGVADASGKQRAPWKTLIAAALKTRGYEEVPAADADFQVAFHLSSSQAATVAYLNQFKGYPASQVFNGPGGKMKTLAKDYTNGLGEPGLLIIDAVVPTENRFLWRGWARTDLRPDSSEQWDQAAAASAVKVALARVPRP